MTTITSTRLEDRIDALDWTDLRRDLDEQGFAVTEPVLHPDECRELAGLFDGERLSLDDRHGAPPVRRRPLPLLRPPVAGARPGGAHRVLRRTWRRSPTRWSERLSGDTPRFPDTHAELLERCRAAGQERPTPLILRYRPGRLERAAPGPLRRGVLPVPGPDRALAIPSATTPAGSSCCSSSARAPRAARTSCAPPQGAFVIFPTRERPNAGKTGYHRVGLRHGVSTVTAGERAALGMIFHDAT